MLLWLLLDIKTLIVEVVVHVAPERGSCFAAVDFERQLGDQRQQASQHRTTFGTSDNCIARDMLLLKLSQMS